MRKRPLALTIIAILHFLYPIGYFFQMVLLYQLTPDQYVEAAGILYDPVRNPHFVYMSVVALVIGYGLYRVRVWAFYIFFANAAFSVGRNIYHLSVAHAAGDTRMLVIGLLVTLFAVSVMGYFLQKHIRAPYFNPRLRWWESAPRFRLQVISLLKRMGSSPDQETLPEVTGTLSDISVGGAFVNTDAVFALGENLHCKFQLGDEVVETPGEVVWLREAREEAAAGIGIRFFDFPKQKQKMINAFVKRENLSPINR